MNSFGELLEEMEQRRKTLEVYSSEPVHEIEDQFSTKNVIVEQKSLPPDEQRGFVVVRGPDGAFAGSIDLESFGAILAPDTHPPWELSDGANPEAIFDFLDDTLFTSFDRAQMLATAREIEERAWRTATGSLYTGFQDRNALSDQREIYDEFQERGEVAVHLYVRDEWDVDGSAIHSHGPDGEIGKFWFVIYDDEQDGAYSCALVAEERDPGSYYGFWTYDRDTVDEIVAHVRSTYGPN